MLKFIYTDQSLHLELMDIDLVNWVDRRCLFATSIGESIAITSERATLLLPDTICEIAALALFLHSERVRGVNVHRCDLDYLEIAFTGYWLSIRTDSHEGIFVTELPDRVESHLWQLWYRANHLLIAGDGVMG